MRHFLSIIGLAGLGILGACQSSDMSFLEQGNTQTQNQAQNQAAAAQEEVPVATGQPQSLENPGNADGASGNETQTAGTQTASADQNPPAPAGGALDAQATQPGQPPSTGAAQQGSLSQAAASGPPVADGTTRVDVKPGGSGFAGNVRHEVNEMFGRTTKVRINDVTTIQTEMVIGSWNLSEEDGLRTCSMAFAEVDDGNGVQVTPGCSAPVATISAWGVFGEDLLLRDSQNSVIVRLRQSGESWVGFTLANGIPIILTR